MIRRLLLPFACTGVLCATAQAPAWQWAQHAGGTGNDRGNDIALDPAGNVLVVGSFSSAQVTFGDTILVNYSDDAEEDFFVVKYDPTGQVLWARQATGPGDQNGYGVSTDASGNVFVGGSYNDSLIVDTFSFSANAFSNCFLAKYGPDGELLWAKSAGGPSTDIVTDVATDATGHLLVVGWFRSNAVGFDGEFAINSQVGSDEIFVARFDTAGEALWVRSAEGEENDWAESITADSQGNVLVTGYFDSSPLDFGTIGLINLGPAGQQIHDIFVAKYDPDGEVLWAKRAGDNHQELAWGIAVDGNDDIFIVGEFMGETLSFGDTDLVNSTTVLEGDAFIAKYSSAGVPLWAASGGGAGYDRARTVAVDADNNVVMSGSADSEEGFFSGLPFATDSTNDFFAAKYSPDGAISWLTTEGGHGSDVGVAVTMDASGAAYFTGCFTDTVTVGDIELDGGGNWDLWVLKMGTSGVGLEEPGADGLLVYPVPSSGTVSIRAEAPIQGLMVRDAIGRVVYQSSPKARAVQVELRTPGLYFAEISVNGNMSTRGLLICQ